MPKRCSLVTDSVAPRPAEHWDGRVETVSVQPLFAEVVQALVARRPLAEVLAQ